MAISPTSARAADRLLTVDETLERILARVTPLAPRRSTSSVNGSGWLVT